MARFKKYISFFFSVYNKHESYEVLCEICGGRYRSQATYNEHVETVHGEKTHLCRFCGFLTARKSSLKRHDISEHNGPNAGLVHDSESSSEEKQMPQLVPQNITYKSHQPQLIKPGEHLT